MDAFLGSIFSFAFQLGTEDTNWKVCNGQFLNIAEYNALFALIGTTYGGDGVKTFGIPNLTGSVAVGAGQMPNGGQNYALAAHGGQSKVQLTAANLQTHSHTPPAVQIPVGGAATTTNPTNAYFGAATANTYSSTTNGNMAANVVVSSFNGINTPTPIDVRPAYVVTCYCICVNGIYPVRPS